MSNEVELAGWTKAIWNGVTTLELAKFVDRTIKENITGLVHIGCEPLNKYEMLQTMKKVYNTNHTIQATDGKAVDKTLVDFYDGYQPKTFEQLLEEQKEWYR
jgi:dTDP-4-dehydrorhamnose reductase